MAMINKRTTLILLVLIFLIGAILRSVNYTYLLFCLLLANIILAFLLPRFSLRNIVVFRKVPTTAHEGDDISTGIEVVNKGLLARDMIEVEDFFPLEIIGKKHPKLFIPRIKGKKNYTYSYKVNCFMRGEYRIGPLFIKSSYPFGLFSYKKKIEDSTSKLLVYPKLFYLKDVPFLLGDEKSPMGDAQTKKLGGNEDFYGTREYMYGDSLRFIHWPSTARHSELIVKEFKKTSLVTVNIILDLHKNSCIGSGRETTLEYAVKIAGSIARFALLAGYQVQIIGFGEKQVCVKASGMQQFNLILDMLTRVDADGELPFVSCVSCCIDDMKENSTSVLITSVTDSGAEGFIDMVTSLKSKRIKPVGIFFLKNSFLMEKKRDSKIQDTILPFFLAHNDPYYIVRKWDNLENIFTP